MCTAEVLGDGGEMVPVKSEMMDFSQDLSRETDFSRAEIQVKKKWTSSNYASQEMY